YHTSRCPSAMRPSLGHLFLYCSLARSHARGVGADGNVESALQSTEQEGIHLRIGDVRKAARERRRFREKHRQIRADDRTDGDVARDAVVEPRLELGQLQSLERRRSLVAVDPVTAPSSSERHPRVELV